MAQPFIPVNEQAGVDQTADKLYFMNGREREGEVEYALTRTHTHTHTHAHTHTRTHTHTKVQLRRQFDRKK